MSFSWTSQPEGKNFISHLLIPLLKMFCYSNPNRLWNILWSGLLQTFRAVKNKTTPRNWHELKDTKDGALNAVWDPESDSRMERYSCKTWWDASNSACLTGNDKFLVLTTMPNLRRTGDPNFYFYSFSCKSKTSTFIGKISVIKL